MLIYIAGQFYSLKVSMKNVIFYTQSQHCVEDFTGIIFLVVDGEITK